MVLSFFALFTLERLKYEKPTEEVSVGGELGLVGGNDG